eukprot:gene5986-6058_t
MSQSSCARRIFDISEALCRAIGNAIRPRFISAALAMAVVLRIQRVRGVLLALEARFVAGTLRRVQRVSVVDEGVAAPDGVVMPPRRSPVRPVAGGVLGWLCPLVPGEAACFAGHMRVVLAEPEMQALLAACPQAVRALGPLCRMLGIERSAFVPAGLAPAVVRVRVRVRKVRVLRAKKVVDWAASDAHYAASGVPRRFGLVGTGALGLLGCFVLKARASHGVAQALLAMTA